MRNVESFFLVANYLLSNACTRCASLPARVLQGPGRRALAGYDLGTGPVSGNLGRVLPIRGKELVNIPALYVLLSFNHQRMQVANLTQPLGAPYS